MPKAAIVWLRHDLRVEDNPALTAAREVASEVIPVYIYSPKHEGRWPPGAASRWWLHHSLHSLSDELADRGASLVVRQGNPRKILLELAKETRASAVFWNRRYEPAIIERDKQIKEELTKKVEVVKSFNASLLFEPWEIANQSGKPYQVYSAFWRACIKRESPPKPGVRLRKISSKTRSLDSIKISDLGLLPRINWDEGLGKMWSPGTKSGLHLLRVFIKNAVHSYDEDRNRPDRQNTSRLSPYLHFGEISPRTIWHEVVTATSRKSQGSETFLKEIVWREFAHHLLYHFPHTSEQPLKQEFKDFPWRNNANLLKAWQRGLTGYPIVDAGMRELWHTGWMHNRVRMIVASFLVKDLMIPWQKGADWFWDTLVDADLANNSLGWQWTAGSGADAAPYFRVFNPILQGEKFDPAGDYVRKWCPELSKLPGKWLHRPFEASADVLANADIELGSNYPKAIVDHYEARDSALEAYDKMRGK